MFVEHMPRVRRLIGGSMLCGGILAASLGLGSGAAQAAVSPELVGPASAVTAVGAGFAEYRPWLHPGRPFYAPRRFYAPPPFFGRPYGYHFHGRYR